MNVHHTVLCERRPGLSGLLGRLTSTPDFSICVRSALSTLIALAGGVDHLGALDDGREAAQQAGDDELAELLRRALEELEIELAALTAETRTAA
jgi:hypothetical protein